MTAKIWHTSDWHLGKKLFKRSRIEEQKCFLEWLFNELQTHKVDALIIAGDIFDTPTPPNDALDLYFSFLEEVSSKTDTHIIIISGNHDSANFIQAPASILKKHNIHIRTRLEKDFEKNIITLKLKERDYHFKCLPYFRTYELYQFLDSEQELDPKDIEKVLTDFSNYWPKESSDSFKIIVAHHAFGEFSATGSEHTVSVMGLENLSLKWFGDSYDYIALGHIHKPQKMSTTKSIYYSGSPIPLRFSEKQMKKVLIVNTDGKEVDFIEIPKFREIIQISSTEDVIEEKLAEVLATIKENKLEAFIEIKLKMTTPNNELTNALFDMTKASGHSLLSLIPSYEAMEDREEKERININELNLNELFNLYYKEKYPENEAPPAELEIQFRKLLEDVNHEIS